VTAVVAGQGRKIRRRGKKKGLLVGKKQGEGKSENWGEEPEKQLIDSRRVRYERTLQRHVEREKANGGNQKNRTKDIPLILQVVHRGTEDALKKKRVTNVSAKGREKGGGERAVKNKDSERND